MEVAILRSFIREAALERRAHNVAKSLEKARQELVALYADVDAGGRLDPMGLAQALCRKRESLAALPALEALPSPVTGERTVPLLHESGRVLGMLANTPGELDTRALVVETCSRSPSLNRLGRRHLAMVSILCGFWPAGARDGMTVSEVVQAEAKAIDSLKARH